MEREIQTLFYMFFGGLTIMMVFYVRDYCLFKWERHKRWCSFLYLLTWIVAAEVFWEFCYRATWGVLNWYGLTAFACGIILWKTVFCVILRLDVTENKQGKGKRHEKKDKRATKKVRRKESREGNR